MCHCLTKTSRKKTFSWRYDVSEVVVFGRVVLSRFLDANLGTFPFCSSHIYSKEARYVNFDIVSLVFYNLYVIKYVLKHFVIYIMFSRRQWFLSHAAYLIGYVFNNHHDCDSSASNIKLCEGLRLRL